MKKKNKIAVIMGGRSSEHDVSMMSGKEIIKNLDKEKYEVFPVVIDKSGKGLEKIIKVNPDVALIALHGKYGEDGKMQGFLESMGIRYTGSKVLASAIGMDKIVFRKLMQSEGLPIPKYFILSKREYEINKKFKPPYFVKPYDGGSSVGTSFVKKGSDLPNALKLAFKYSEIAIVDEYIKGLEVNCGVLGNQAAVALPVIEIHPVKSTFFDYKSKYSDGGSLEIVPAKISDKLTKRIQDMSLKIYKAVGCSGYARIDYILKNGTDPIVLEINTLPGMTSNSLLPKEAAAAGISYSELLNKIINLAMS